MAKQAIPTGRLIPWERTILGNPQSKANSRRIVMIQGKTRSIKSSAAIAYANDFAKQCPVLDPMFETDICVELMIYYASRRSDLDESLILDCLQGKVISNDRLVKKKLWSMELMQKTQELTYEFLRSRISYNARTGAFTWLPLVEDSIKSKIWNSNYAWKEAGHIGAEGYRRIRINNNIYLASRLAWFYVKETWPDKNIDHKNRNRSDDRWENLREASQSQNMMNTTIRKDNKSGVKGVYWYERDKKWKVTIQVNKKSKFIGTFDSKEEAVVAYKKAAADFFGEFYHA